MNEQGKKWRKRSRDSDAAEEVLKRSKHEPVDKPSVKGLDQNSIFGGVTEEQMLMLESVKGHIKELKQVSDSTLDSHRQHSEEPISKSEARRLKKKQKQTEELSKSSSDGGSSKETSTPSCRETALEYLRVWDQERERWSFKKKTQFWLLHNMYKKAMVSILCMTAALPMIPSLS